MLLRPFQIAAEKAGHESLLACGRGILSLATGTGKTVIAAKLAERWREYGRSLVLCPREEILDQFRDKISTATLLSCGIEQAERRVTRRSLPDVVIASVATLARQDRRLQFLRDDFALVIVDEAHHAAASSWREVLRYFDAARIGLTATPDRADGLSLRPYLGDVVFEYPIRKAVRDGYLCDVRRVVEMVPGLDLSHIRVRAGDFDAGELEAELLKAPAVAGVAASIAQRAGERPTIAFCAGIQHSRAVAAALNALRPGYAAAADGGSREGVALFRAGSVRVLCNTDLTSEGFDHPPTACVALVRPTKSVLKATQEIGRGTRLADGKSDCLVIEFVGGSVADQITTVGAVGADYSARVRQLAEMALDRSPQLSVIDALEQAAAKANEGAITRGRIALRPIVDPMRVILGLDGMVLEPARPGAAAASSAQVKELERNGLVTTGLNVRQASILLDGIRWRTYHRRCSPQQALLLYQFGFDLECSTTEAAQHLAKMRVA